MILLGLLAAAMSAAPPAVVDVELRYYEFATVSITVTSQTAHLPELHGTRVMPSGRFPSDLDKPTGSLTEGTTTRERAREMMSFRL